MHNIYVFLYRTLHVVLKQILILKAKPELEETDTLSRYIVSGPGQADNGVGEMVDLNGIYIVDNEVTKTTDVDEYPAANGSVHVNGTEQLVCFYFNAWIPVFFSSELLVSGEYICFSSPVDIILKENVWRRHEITVTPKIGIFII